MSSGFRGGTTGAALPEVVCLRDSDDGLEVRLRRAREDVLRARARALHAEFEARRSRGAVRSLSGPIRLLARLRPPLPGEDQTEHGSSGTIDADDDGAVGGGSADGEFGSGFSNHNGGDCSSWLCIRGDGTELEVLPLSSTLAALPSVQMPSQRRRMTIAGIGDARALTINSASALGKRPQGGASRRASSSSSSSTFTFDRVLGADAGDDEAFQAVEDEVAAVADGHAACIFAYGASGSGKSHNIRILSAGASNLLEQRAAVLSKEGMHLDIGVRIVEIFDERIAEIPCYFSDDATSSSASLPQTLPSWRGALDDRLSCMHSTSHLAVIFMATRRDPETNTVQAVGRLCLVDLAGSDRPQRDEAASAHCAREGRLASASLSALADVLAARARRCTEVPHRASRLTAFLQDTIFARHDSCRIVVLVGIEPSRSALPQTLRTLQYAQRLSSLTVHAVGTGPRCQRLHQSSNLEGSFLEASPQQSCPSVIEEDEDTESSDREVGFESKDKVQEIAELRSQLEELREATAKAQTEAAECEHSMEIKEQMLVEALQRAAALREAQAQKEQMMGGLLEFQRRLERVEEVTSRSPCPALDRLGRSFATTGASTPSVAGLPGSGPRDHASREAEDLSVPRRGLPSASCAQNPPRMSGRGLGVAGTFQPVLRTRSAGLGFNRTPGFSAVPSLGVAPPRRCATALSAAPAPTTAASPSLAIRVSADVRARSQALEGKAQSPAPEGSYVIGPAAAVRDSSSPHLRQRCRSPQQQQQPLRALHGLGRQASRPDATTNAFGRHASCSPPRAPGLGSAGGAAGTNGSSVRSSAAKNASTSSLDSRSKLLLASRWGGKAIALVPTPLRGSVGCSTVVGQGVSRHAELDSVVPGSSRLVPVLQNLSGGVPSLESSLLRPLVPRSHGEPLGAHLHGEGGGADDPGRRRHASESSSKPSKSSASSTPSSSSSASPLSSRPLTARVQVRAAGGLNPLALDLSRVFKDKLPAGTSGATSPFATCPGTVSARGSMSARGGPAGCSPEPSTPRGRAPVCWWESAVKVDVDLTPRVAAPAELPRPASEGRPPIAVPHTLAVTSAQAPAPPLTARGAAFTAQRNLPPKLSTRSWSPSGYTVEVLTARAARALSEGAAAAAAGLDMSMALVPEAAEGAVGLGGVFVARGKDSPDEEPPSAPGSPVLMLCPLSPSSGPEASRAESHERLVKLQAISPHFGSRRDSGASAASALSDVSESSDEEEICARLRGSLFSAGGAGGDLAARYVREGACP